VAPNDAHWQPERQLDLLTLRWFEIRIGIHKRDRDTGEPLWPNIVELIERSHTTAAWHLGRESAVIGTIPPLINGFDPPVPNVSLTERAEHALEITAAVKEFGRVRYVEFCILSLRPQCAQQVESGLGALLRGTATRSTGITIIQLSDMGKLG
jgi:hypothetical protein